MPATREYEVSGTVYEFPDTYSDGQVKDILTKKGIIKVDRAKTPDLPPRKSLLQSGAEAAYEAKYGMPAPASLGTGGLGGIVRSEIAAPATIMAPVSTAVGMGTGEAVRRGAHALGASDTASDIAGTIAGTGAGLATGIPRAIGRAAGRAISRIPTGGVVSDVAGVISPRIAHGINLVNRVRKIFGVLPEEITPFPPGKGTAVKYGGPTEPEFGPPGKLIPRRSPTETPLTTPYPPGKGTGTKYGGPAPTEYGPSYRRTPKRSLGSRTVEQTEVEQATPQPSLENRLQKSIEQNRVVKAGRIAKLLDDSGINRDLAERATPAQRNEIARQIGIKSVSKETWDQVLGELDRRSPTSPIPAPRKRGIMFKPASQR